MKKVKVGQTVYLAPIGENARRNYNDNILEGVREQKITKIGRKYFYLNCLYPERFYLDNFEQDTCYEPRWQVYFSMQEIFNDIDKERIIWKVADSVKFGRTNLSVDQLRRIEKIIDEGDQDESN